MLIPIHMVRDVHEAIAFHTSILDFELALANPPESPFYAILTRGRQELHLNLAPAERLHSPSSVIVLCEDVDGLFSSFLARGLVPPTREGSPAHEHPLDQTWGTREVYIDDPSGNTIIFQQR